MMKYEVTQVLWESVMGEGENPSDFRGASHLLRSELVGLCDICQQPQ